MRQRLKHTVILFLVLVFILALALPASSHSPINRKPTFIKGDIIVQ